MNTTTEVTLKTLTFAFRAYCLDRGVADPDALLSEFVRGVKFDSWNTGAHFQALLDGRTPQLDANPYAPVAALPVEDLEQPTLDFGTETP